MIAALLNRFDLCLAQSANDAERYAKLGAPRVSATGNLKLDIPALPADEAALRRLRDIIGKRPVVVAASTHPGEEAAVIGAHRRLRAKFPRLLTIIAPRHPGRGANIAESAKGAGLAVALRSRRAQPMPDIGVYVADTLGELGLMYRLGHELRRRGLWVAPVDYPAVPQNRICFRACVTAKHTRADLDEALNILEDTLVPALLQKQSA